MQLVIDIPENLVCEGFERPFTEEEKNVLIKAIGNGKPLPEHHGRLIDADAQDDVITGLNREGWEITRSDYKTIDRVLFEFPTIIDATEE